MVAGRLFRPLLLLVLAPLVFSAGCQLAAKDLYRRVPPAAGVRPIRVLFIGNSLTFYNDLAGLLHQFSLREERPLDVDSVTFATATLKFHYTSTAARKHLDRGGWDYVVLQEYSRLAADDPDATMRNYRRWSGEVARIGSKPIIFENWTHQGRRGDWQKMRRTYEQVQAVIGGEISPIGEAWQIALEKHPEIDLFADYKHPNVAGTYLTACVIYGTIYHKPAAGLPAQLEGLKLPPQTARVLQSVADEVGK